MKWFYKLFLIYLLQMNLHIHGICWNSKEKGKRKEIFDLKKLKINIYQNTKSTTGIFDFIKFLDFVFLFFFSCSFPSPFCFGSILVSSYGGGYSSPCISLTLDTPKSPTLLLDANNLLSPWVYYSSFWRYWSVVLEINLEIFFLEKIGLNSWLKSSDLIVVIPCSSSKAFFYIIWVAYNFLMRVSSSCSIYLISCCFFCLR